MIFTRATCYSFIAIHTKPHTWTHNSPQINLGTTQNSPKNSTPDHPKIVPEFQFWTVRKQPRKSSFGLFENSPKNPAFGPKFLGLKCTAVPTPNTLTICMTLRQELNQIRENPYLTEFVEKPGFSSLCEALVMWKNFASCSDRNRQSDHWKF